MNDQPKTWKTLGEQLETSGKDLLGEINRLLAEGNVRRLVVKSEEGHVFLSIPVTAGVLAGGLLALSAPWLAAVSALAGVLGRIKLEVVRTDDADDAPTPPAP